VKIFGQAGGLQDIRRWLWARQRPTPPEIYDEKNSIPEGCKMAWLLNIWHPSGVLYFIVIHSGGVARQASLNHRLMSFKPPA
jgi:hypothetical protein